MLRAAAGLALAAAFARPAAAQGPTREEALRLAFPAPAEIQRRTAFLDDAALAQARRLAGPGAEIAGGVVTYYVATQGGRPVGAAYFDAHRVRTLRQVLMVVVGPDDRIRRVEVLRFQEPPEYRAPEGWLAQLEGKTLDQRLSLKGGVVNMTGATLTSNATVAAARRVLALHAVIRPFGGGAGRTGGTGGTR